MFGDARGKMVRNVNQGMWSSMQGFSLRAFHRERDCSKCEENSFILE